MSGQHRPRVVLLRKVIEVREKFNGKRLIHARRIGRLSTRYRSGRFDGEFIGAHTANVGRKQGASALTGEGHLGDASWRERGTTHGVFEESGRIFKTEVVYRFSVHFVSGRYCKTYYSGQQ